MTPQELADELIGTCNLAIIDERLDTDAAVAEFDDLAFNCHQCGWWCSTDELNNLTDDDLCDQCLEENEGVEE